MSGRRCPRCHKGWATTPRALCPDCARRLRLHRERMQVAAVEAQERAQMAARAAQAPPGAANGGAVTRMVDGVEFVVSWAGVGPLPGVQDWPGWSSPLTQAKCLEGMRRHSLTARD